MNNKHTVYCGNVFCDSGCPMCVVARAYENKTLSEPEPQPSKNDLPYVWDLVVKDMIDRDNSGVVKYNTRLQPHNGRNVLIDAYQEALDLAVYLRQAIYERDGK